jgi:hypothetical protein
MCYLWEERAVSYLYDTHKGYTMTTTSEAVELFLASLRTRSAPANTIKSYSHDPMHFVQAVPGTVKQDLLE